MGEKCMGVYSLFHVVYFTQVLFYVTLKTWFSYSECVTYIEHLNFWDMANGIPVFKKFKILSPEQPGNTGNMNVHTHLYHRKPSNISH